MTGPALGPILNYVLLVGCALMALKLYWTGLYRRYPFFFLYFLLRVPNSLWPLFLARTSPLYFKLWVITSPLFLILYVLMVFELYRVVLNKYQGIRTLGQWAIYVISGVSLTVSALTLLPRITPDMPQTSKAMGYMVALERGIDTSCAIFMILLISFLSYFPIKLNRNVRVYAVIYPIFFFSSSLVVLMKSLFGMRMIQDLSTSLSILSALSVLAWLMLLSAKGEEVPATISPMPKNYEERLLTQLDAINATMLRVSRHQG